MKSPLKPLPLLLIAFLAHPGAAYAHAAADPHAFRTPGHLLLTVTGSNLLMAITTMALLIVFAGKKNLKPALARTTGFGVGLMAFLLLLT